MPCVVEYFGQSLKAALSRRINMVTFANLGSVRVPSSKFVGLRVRKIQRIQCVSCHLQQFHSYSIAKKSSFLRTPAFIFCLPWGRPCGNHAKRCMDEKTIQCLPNLSPHVSQSERQFTVVQTVLTATFNSYGNTQISTPYKISTPEPIEKKFGTVD